MLTVPAIALIALWAVGWYYGILGGYIHILLVAAVIVIAAGYVKGRRLA